MNSTIDTQVSFMVFKLSRRNIDTVTIVNIYNGKIPTYTTQNCFTKDSLTNNSCLKPLSAKRKNQGDANSNIECFNPLWQRLGLI